MKPMNEKHFAILRRHMVDVMGIHTGLLEEELGKATLEERILTTLLRVPRRLFVPEALAHVAAAAEVVPAVLLEQLEPNGRPVMPLGPRVRSYSQS